MLKLKVVALHDGIGKEVYMTQIVRFIVAYLNQLVELNGARLDKQHVA